MLPGTKKNRKHRLGIAAMLFSCLLLAGCNRFEPGNQTKEYSQTDGSSMEVYFLDIGQGDATLVKNGDHTMLIDCGENDRSVDLQLYLEQLGVEKLDYLILTHPDSDHIGGADCIIEKYEINSIFMTDYQKDSSSYQDVMNAIGEKNDQVLIPKTGDSFYLGDARITFLGPVKEYEDANNSSLVFTLQKGLMTFLFTGDAGAEAEGDLLALGRLSDVDFFQAGHHGSRKSNSKDFLAVALPEYVAISCGQDNEYGYPHEKTLERIEECGAKAYTTSELGTILAICDGTDIKLQWGKEELEIPKDYVVANRKSRVVHKATCDKLPATENQVIFSSKEEANKAGFSKECGNCR